MGILILSTYIREKWDRFIPCGRVTQYEGRWRLVKNTDLKVITLATALEINPDVDLMDLLDVQYSQRYSIQYNPMMRGAGGTQGSTFIRGAVPWKGKEFDGFNEAIKGIENDGVTQGLDTLQNLVNSAQMGQASGVALAQNDAGQVYPIPQSAANMVDAAQAQGFDTGVDIIATGFASVNDALQDRRTAEPKVPTIA